MIKYRWATLGCGVIANQLAQALQAQGSNLYSVANRTHDKAVAFAEKYGIEKVYEDIDEVFTDDNVDIIYISTPHNTHIKYLRKGWFLSEKPDQILSQVKYAPTLHAKQPKRGLIAFDKGYVELYEYPRGQEAVITYTKDGHTETIREGETNRALEYEVQDMEAAVAGEKDDMHLDYTRDVMDMMTQIRQEWGMRYPEEE